LWAASSTHEGEEEVVAETHNLLKKLHPDVLTILVPRHPHQAERIRSLLEASRLKVAQRSLGEIPELSTDIFLFDSTGELGLVYRLCSITLVAGSLVEGIGGHNPLEAALLKCAVLVGPYTKNNQEIYDLLEKDKGYKVVHTPQELAQTIDHLLKHPQEKKSLLEHSFTVAMAQQQVFPTIRTAMISAGIAI
jgi:3-deoxy-D-manno-octulosonic-acid transferase